MIFLFIIGCSQKDTKELQKACNDGNLTSCHKIAIGYNGGNYGFEQNGTKALILYEKNCDNGYGESCKVCGFRYEHSFGIKRDFEKAYTLYKKGCDLDFAPACEELAKGYKEGKNIPQDFELSEKFLQKAIRLYTQKCDENSSKMCYKLGDLYRFLKTLHDDKKANFYYKKGCDLGYESSCGTYKFMQEEQKKMQKRKLQCENSDISACVRVAEYYKFNHYKEVEGKKEAKKYYKKACNLDDISSCKNLYKNIYNDEAVATFKKYCEKNDAESCKYLAQKYLYNKQIENAYKYYKKACSLKDETSCKYIGVEVQ